MEVKFMKGWKALFDEDQDDSEYLVRIRDYRCHNRIDKHRGIENLDACQNINVSINAGI
jgi:hypothetical protein